jgi:hypothetical protein
VAVRKWTKHAAPLELDFFHAGVAINMPVLADLLQLRRLTCLIARMRGFVIGSDHAAPAGAGFLPRWRGYKQGGPNGPVNEKT